MHFFSISVVYIKEETEDVSFSVPIEPDVNSLPIKDYFNTTLVAEKNMQIIGNNCTLDDLVIKEESLEESSVSKCWNNFVPLFQAFIMLACMIFFVVLFYI